MIPVEKQIVRDFGDALARCGRIERDRPGAAGEKLARKMRQRAIDAMLARMIQQAVPVARRSVLARIAARYGTRRYCRDRAGARWKECLDAARG